MDQRLLVHREPRTRPQPKTIAQWRPKVVTWLRHSLPRVWVSPAQTGPTRARQSPLETQSVLTVDWSTLTVDLGPHVSDTEPLDPPVSWWHHADVIMTSCGFHLSVAQDPRSHLSD